MLEHGGLELVERLRELIARQVNLLHLRKEILRLGLFRDPSVGDRRSSRLISKDRVDNNFLGYFVSDKSVGKLREQFAPRCPICVLELWSARYAS